MTKLIALLATLAFAAGAQAGGNFLSVKSKRGHYEDVRDDLVLAIESRGIKINHINHIAEMLARTGQDLGAGRQVYARGEQVEFCKSDLSRAQMEADPANMVFCPYIVSVYTLPRDEHLVYVAFRKPLAPGAGTAARKALGNVERLLNEIVDEVVKN